MEALSILIISLLVFGVGGNMVITLFGKEAPLYTAIKAMAKLIGFRL